MHAPVPPDVLAAILAHFQTRYGRRDDAAHLATYTPDAFVVVGDVGLRRNEADPVGVLAAWATAETTREPRFRGPSVASWHPDNAALGVAVVDVRESTTGAMWRVAMGMVQSDASEPAWQVDWATLLDGEPQSYQGQRLVALAELAGLRSSVTTHPNAPPTSLLEAAYARRCWLPRTMLLSLPETRFTCQGTGACCRHELTIGLDDNSAAFVAAVDWQALVPDLGAGPYTEPMPAAAATLVSFRHRLAREADGRCRFLDDHNRCRVHALAGRAVFKPCHVFPYRFAASPDGICVTTHAMCPVARGACGQPLAAQEEELRSRLAVADVLRPDKFTLRPNQEIPWEIFRRIENQLLDLLNAEAPIKQKLWVALRWLDTVLVDAEVDVPPDWFDEAIPRAGWMQRAAFGRLAALFDPCFKDLQRVPAGEGLLLEQEAELTRWFRSLLFSKVLTYPYGLVAGLNYLALVHAVLERQVARHASRGISEDFWREFYAVITSGTFLRLLQACHDNPATRFARNAASPVFGKVMLGL